MVNMTTWIFWDIKYILTNFFKTLDVGILWYFQLKYVHTLYEDVPTI